MSDISTIREILELLKWHISGHTDMREFEKAEAALNKLMEQPAEKVNRLEVIDDTGRAYVKGSIYGSPVSIKLSYQDDGRTLKVFVEALKKGMA